VLKKWAGHSPIGRAVSQATMSAMVSSQVSSQVSKLLPKAERMTKYEPAKIGGPIIATIIRLRRLYFMGAISGQSAFSSQREELMQAQWAESPAS
jgi:hypothetical protein